MTNIEKIGCFNTVLDVYNGITILQEDLPSSNDEFELNLNYLLEETKNKVNLIWIYINIKKSNFIPTVTKAGFFFHSCDEEYILVVKRVKPNAIVPTAANHTLGVGAVVINDQDELLVIKERRSTIGYKLPGGHIDNGELISTALKREVKEETGIEIEFESIISLGHFYPHQFHKSNLYVLCTAKALSSKINIEDIEEIIDAKWVNVYEYLEDENVLEYSKEIVRASLKSKGFNLGDLGVLAHVKKNFELFFPNSN